MDKVQVKEIYSGELPPEVGPPGKRLIVVLENGRFDTVLIEKPLSNIMLSNCLKQLAKMVLEGRE
jgi:hypothetical protein